MAISCLRWQWPEGREGKTRIGSLGKKGTKAPVGVSGTSRSTAVVVVEASEECQLVAVERCFGFHTTVGAGKLELGVCWTW